MSEQANIPAWLDATIKANGRINASQADKGAFVADLLCADDILVSSPLLELIDAVAESGLDEFLDPDAERPLETSAETGRYETFLKDETDDEQARFEAYDARLAAYAAKQSDEALGATLILFNKLGVRRGVGAFTKEMFARVWRQAVAVAADDKFTSATLSDAVARDTAWTLANVPAESPAAAPAAQLESRVIESQ